MVISLVILDRNLMVKPQNMFDPNDYWLYNAF